jgi:hypothetical protein
MRAFPKTAARDDLHVTASVFCRVALAFFGSLQVFHTSLSSRELWHWKGHLHDDIHGCHPLSIMPEACRGYP